jgi:glycosyltransferase involved in cell wall biosynthesis
MAQEERYKGHDVLIDAWPLVEARHPGARLVIAGDGDDRTRLEQKARALGVDGITFTGPVDAATRAALYRDAAFFVMPSTGEGFGLVYLEAMRAGLACIGGPGAPAEIIRHGVTGLIVEPGAVARAVIELFGDPAACATMGQAGAARVQEHFTSDAFGRRLTAVFAGHPTTC